MIQPAGTNEDGVRGSMDSPVLQHPARKNKAAELGRRAAFALAVGAAGGERRAKGVLRRVGYSQSFGPRGVPLSPLTETVRAAHQALGRSFSPARSAALRSDNETPLATFQAAS